MPTTIHLRACSHGYTLEEAELVVQEQDFGFGKRMVKPGERWFDTRKIDVREPGEIDFWAKFFGVDGVAILFAVDKVGTQAARVREFLRQDGSLH